MKFKDLRKVLSQFDCFQIMSCTWDNSGSIECCGDTIDKVANLQNLSDKDVIYITPTDDGKLYIVVK